MIIFIMVLHPGQAFQMQNIEHTLKSQTTLGELWGVIVNIYWKIENVITGPHCLSDIN